MNLKNKTMSNEASKTTDNPERRLFGASATDFKKIPGNPLAYWASQQVFNLFKINGGIGTVVKPRQGMSTNDNKRFLRYWSEMSFNKIGFGFASSYAAIDSGLKWFPLRLGWDISKVVRKQQIGS